MSLPRMEERLQTLARELAETYPYYKSLRKQPLRFEELPIIDKLIVNENRNQFELAHAVPLLESFTSGSTGIPFRCIKTLDEKMKLSMAIHRHRRKWGLPLRHRAVLLGDTLFGQPRMTAHYANQIAQTSPHMIQGRCSGLYELAAYYAKNNRPVQDSLLFVQNWGECVQPTHRKVIEDVFRVPLLDYYGLEEIWMIAFSNKMGHLEIDEQIVHVEILNTQTHEPVLDGEIGDIVVTSFILKQMPFVRYRTGDLGRTYRDGMNGKRILELLPVRSSQIKLQGRTVSTAVFRYLDQFYHQLTVEMDMRQFQMIQETFTSFRLLIVSETANNERLVDATKKLELLLKQSLFVDQLHISIQCVAQIPPHPISGKFQPFVSLVS